MKKISSILFLLLSLFASGQHFQKTYSAGNFLTDLIETNDHGSLILGVDNSTSNFWFLQKNDSVGGVEWCKHYPKAGTYDSFIQLSDGSYMAAGLCNYGPGRYFLMKLNEFGDPLFYKVLDSADYNAPAALIYLGNNRIMFISGYINSTSNIVGIQMFNMDEMGNVSSSVLLSSSNTTDVYNVFKAIRLHDGNILLGGEGGASNSFVIKTDTSGNVIWAKEVDNIYCEYFNDLTSSPSDDIILVTKQLTNCQTPDFSIVTKLDSGGGVIWSNNLVNAITVNCVGNNTIINAGSSSVRLDNSGNIEKAVSFLHFNIVKSIVSYNNDILAVGNWGNSSCYGKFDTTFNNSCSIAQSEFATPFNRSMLNKTLNVQPVSITFSDTTETDSSLTNIPTVACFGNLSVEALNEKLPVRFENNKLYLPAENCLVEIYSLDSKLIFKSQSFNNPVLQLPQLPKGIYFYSVSTNFRRAQGKYFN